MKCPHCQTDNPDTTHFCGECGRRLYSPGDTPLSQTQTLQIAVKKLKTGAVFADRYQVLEELGSGGMGRVYKVFDKKIEEEVALKLVNPSVASDEEMIDRFRNELKYARKISHRNVCRMYDISESHGTQFITMEFVPGHDLSDLIKEKGKIDLEETISIAQQVCEGLAEAHMLGVVHRDLKPHNIRINNEGKASIMDFGIAHSTLSSDWADEGMIVGTPYYMSPEQAEGDEIDQTTDIYSLGIILYEMATGKVPFTGNTPLGVALRHKKEVPLPPREIDDKIPEGLNYIILKCLEKNREKRYQRAEEVLSDLMDIEQNIPLTTFRKRPFVPVPFISHEDEAVGVERAVFVGRKTELETMNRLLDSSLSGKGQVLFINGEAGSGKTALIQEFSCCAQDRYPDLIVVSGNCNAQTGVGDPYLPFREVLGLLTGDVEARWAAGSITREQVIRLWNIHRLSVQAVMDSGPDLIDIFVKGASLFARAKEGASKGADWIPRLKKLVEMKTAATSAMLNQRDLFEQYVRVLQELVQMKPLLITLDDLQWADAGSISLLSYLVRRFEKNRTFLIGAYRPTEVSMGRDGQRHPLESVITEFKRHYGDFIIDLGQTDDRQFIEDFINSEPNRLEKEFLKTLYGQTKGHPLFTVELLRSMQEQGMLIKDEEGCWVEGPSLNWGKLPARVEAVVEERIGQLQEDQRDVLTLASVEGEEFTGEVVAKLKEIDDLEMVRLLSADLDKRHRLINALGIRQMNGNRLSLYRFRHILFQKYLYGRLDQAQRTYLHDKVGSILEELYKDQSKEIAVQLVRHFQESGNVAKEIDYLEKAGERAVFSYANHEAIQYLERALALEDSAETRAKRKQVARWEYLLAEAYFGLGSLEESRPHLERTLILLGCPVPTKRWKLIAGLVKHILLQLFFLLRPSRLIGHGKDKEERALEASRAFERLAEMSYYTQDRDIALYSSLRALNSAMRIGPCPELARNYANLVVAAGIVSLHSLSQKFSRLARQISQEVDSPHTFGYALMCTAAYNLGIGKWDTAREDAERAVEIFHEIGNWHRWEVLLSIQGFWALLNGKYRKSAELYNTLYRSAVGRGDIQNKCWGLSGQAFAKLRLGRHDDVVAALRSVDLENLRDEHRYEKISVSAALALAYLRCGDYKPALEAGEMALQMFARSDPRYATLNAYHSTAETFLRSWEFNSDRSPEREEFLVSSAREACKALNKYARIFPIGRPSAWLWQGLFDWIGGKPDKASKAWSKSLSEAEKLEMPYERGLAHFEIGRHSSGRSRKRQLAQACKIFHKLGALYDLARSEEALDNPEPAS